MVSFYMVVGLVAGSRVVNSVPGQRNFVLKLELDMIESMVRAGLVFGRALLTVHISRAI